MDNFYKPPASDVEENVELVEATKGRRFVNFLLDAIALSILTPFFVSAPLVTTRGIRSPDEVWLWFLGIQFGYYFFSEGLFGRTPAKLLTGTRVVDLDGARPTLWRIFRRTLSRFFPFEPLSFLTRGTGWHDRWSDTVVVYVRAPASVDEPSHLRRRTKKKKKN